MRRWAVTGPIAAGKSAVAALLAARGAAVVDGDRLGHRILAEPAIVAALRAQFGAAVAPAGVVDRAVLGRLVFADAQDLAALDRITHGPLSDLMEQVLVELEAGGLHALAVLEAAVYFRLPTPPRVDLTIAVLATPKMRADRLVARGGLTPAAAWNLVAAQDHLTPDWARADITILNDEGPAKLNTAVARLWDEHAT